MMLSDLLRSTKVRIGLALLLVGLSAFLLNPAKKNPLGILPQLTTAKTPESPAPPSNAQAQADAARLNDAVDRKIDSVVRLITEMIE